MSSTVPGALSGDVPAGSRRQPANSLGNSASPAPVARSVLITGGNRGIGRAIATAFAAAGDRVAVTYRTGSQDLPAGALGVRCDVRSSAEVDSAFATVEAAHGPVQVLVSNAGVTRDGLLLRMAEQDVQDVLDTNLTAAFRVAKRALGPMLRARAGRLVFISSVVGLSGAAGQANYAAAKAGLVGLSRSLARELGSRGITANVVAPGPVATDMFGALTDAQQQSVIAQVPLLRVASPEEIAAAVLFLASPQAGYITGAVLPVDGGLGIGH